MTPADERAAVVRWLRTFEWSIFRSWVGWRIWRSIWVINFASLRAIAAILANAIERGEHHERTDDGD